MSDKHGNCNVCGACGDLEGVRFAGDEGGDTWQVFLCPECRAAHLVAETAEATRRFLDRWPQLKSRVPK